MSKFDKYWLGFLVVGLIIITYHMTTLGVTMKIVIPIVSTGIVVLGCNVILAPKNHRPFVSVILIICFVSCVSILLDSRQHRNDNITPIQKKFISQSTMTVHMMKDTAALVASVGDELLTGIYEIKVACSIAGAENIIFISALYIGQVPSMGKEVDLIRVEQSGSDPYENLNGQLSSFLLAQPKLLKTDLKNDSHPGM